MEGSGGVLFDIKRLTQLYCEMAHESGVSVMNERFGESYALEHVFQVKFGDSFCRDRFVAWYKYDGFGAVMVGDREYGVVAI